MSLVRKQAAFLTHVGELLRRAGELGFVVTGGELYRTPEQQAIHVRNGRSKTMNSQHLKRLAIDLNFFREGQDGSFQLVYDADVLRPLGEFWESLDAANRWGGNWTSFKDTPHFERREEGAPSVLAPEAAPAAVPAAPTVTAATVAPPASTRGVGLLDAAVGPRCRNLRDDVETVQRLLNLCLSARRLELDAPLKADGAFGRKTHEAICAFQRSALGQTEPDGEVSPRASTLVSLCVSLPDELNADLLALLYLRAPDQAVEEFVGRIAATMAKRGIDTALRRVHFLAQIGHESGELQFREEIASGAAYEGRADLGNTQPGDGPRFKGRGLIQLTGRANYEAYGKAIGRKDELLADPGIVAEDPELCVDVAGWFWEKHGLNTLADRDDLIAVTRRINGGTRGLEDRRRLLQRGKHLLVV
jgi:predicted chitinase